MNNFTRKQFLQGSIAVTLGMAAPRSVIGAWQHQEDWEHRWNLRTDPQAEGLTAYLNHGNVFVRYNNLPVLNYRAYPSLKYPYFTPMNGPVSGLSLTTESALPYPHHRGVWLGCDPLDGGNYWGDNELSIGHIRSTDLQLQDPDEGGVVTFTNNCEWIREDASSPFEDRRIFKVSIPNENTRLIECSLAITARKNIQIDRAKHSFFAIRSAPDIAPTYGGTLLNSNGEQGAEGTYGKPADWCAFYGPRRLRTDVVEGIAVINHPDNFGGNCPWFTRDYGHLSPQPFEFLDEPFQMSRGETLELKYFVVLFAGTPEQANLNAIFRQWV